jgi:tRNA-specific adenosine deaminase 3
MTTQAASNVARNVDANDETADTVSDAVLAALRPIVDAGRSETMLADPPLVCVVIARVQPRQVSDVVAVLAEHLPLREGLGHVKRVRKSRSSSSASEGAVSGELDVLLSAADAWPPSSRAVADALAPFELHIRKCSVPALAPLSREELALWGKLWPMQFRPVRGANLPPPTPVELRAMARHLRSVVAMANGQRQKGHIPPVAAMLVHPETDVVVSKAIDMSERDSLAPAKRLRHAVFECISKASIPQARKDAATAAVEAMLPLSADSAPRPESLSLYLCTGLDVFLSREPCIMCSSKFISPYTPSRSHLVTRPSKF